MGAVTDQQVSEAGGTCSAVSAALREPLAGTAAVAATWVCLEQPGPWGREALVDSRLDTHLGAALARRGEESGVRIQLIRRPGRHPDTGDTRARRVYAAHTRPGASWLRELEIEDPAQLLDLDFERLALGHHDDAGRAVNAPVMLVCTNGRRDRCCALWGRALLDEIGGHHTGTVWETTHTGGHRFAPACVVLPSGYTYGRLGGTEAEAVLSAAAADKVVTGLCRGRSTWSRAGQAAELAVREEVGEYLAGTLTATDVATGLVRVEHRDGRGWDVHVREVTLHPARPNSCGKADSCPTAWTAEAVTPLRR